MNEYTCTIYFRSGKTLKCVIEAGCGSEAVDIAHIMFEDIFAVAVGY